MGWPVPGAKCTLGGGCRASPGLVVTLTCRHSKAEVHEYDMGASCGWASAAQFLLHIYDLLVVRALLHDPPRPLPLSGSLFCAATERLWPWYQYALLCSRPRSPSHNPTVIGFPHESHCDRNRSFSLTEPRRSQQTLARAPTTRRHVSCQSQTGRGLCSPVPRRAAPPLSVSSPCIAPFARH